MVKLWGLHCWRHEVICHWSSLIRLVFFHNRLQSCVVAAVDATLWTLWTLCWNADWAVDIHHFNVWTVNENLCKLDSLLWVFSAQLHVYLQNVTLKFKLLYLLKHVNCFNKIYRMDMFGWNPFCHCWNTEVLLGGCFLLVHPVELQVVRCLIWHIVIICMASSR